MNQAFIIDLLCLSPENKKETHTLWKETVYIYIYVIIYAFPSSCSLFQPHLKRPRSFNVSPVQVTLTAARSDLLASAPTAPSGPALWVAAALLPAGPEAVGSGQAGLAGWGDLVISGLFLGKSPNLAGEDVLSCFTGSWEPPKPENLGQTGDRPRLFTKSNLSQTRLMGLTYLPISWGVFRGYCRHIFQSH